MDRSAELQALHTAKRAAARLNAKKAPRSNAAKGTSELSLRHLEKLVRQTCSEAVNTVSDAMSAMNGVSPVHDIEEQLILHEADLVSVSSSCAALRQSIEASLLAEASRNSSEKSCTTLLEHLRELISILQERVSDHKLAVVLCREELAQYKNELARDMAAGYCQRDCVTPTSNGHDKEQQERSSRGVTPPAETPGNKESTLVHNAQKALSFATQSVARLAGRPANADTKTTAGTSGSVPQVPPSCRTFDFTEAEKAAFTEEAHQLQLLHRDETLTSVAEVEVSVRQLSQLTSLINERLLSQNEQISIVHKNTQQSKQNVENANKELRRPLASMWNATRLLILLIWLQTLVVVILHWLIR